MRVGRQVIGIQVVHDSSGRMEHCSKASEQSAWVQAPSEVKGLVAVELTDGETLVRGRPGTGVTGFV